MYKLLHDVIIAFRRSNLAEDEVECGVGVLFREAPLEVFVSIIGIRESL